MCLTPKQFRFLLSLCLRQSLHPPTCMASCSLPLLRTLTCLCLLPVSYHSASILTQWLLLYTWTTSQALPAGEGDSFLSIGLTTKHTAWLSDAHEASHGSQSRSNDSGLGKTGVHLPCSKEPLGRLAMGVRLRNEITTHAICSSIFNYWHEDM